MTQKHNIIHIYCNAYDALSSRIQFKNFVYNNIISMQPAKYNLLPYVIPLEPQTGFLPLMLHKGGQTSAVVVGGASEVVLLIHGPT